MVHLDKTRYKRRQGNHRNYQRTFSRCSYFSDFTGFSDSWLIFAQAAFIAGVQGQILTICVNVNVTNGAGKKRATICAFVGLLLDILGASIGVVHTLLLKQRVNDNAQILSLITAFKDEADLFTLNTNQETGADIVEVKIAKDGSPDGRRQNIENFAKKMKGRFDPDRLPENFDRVTNILDYSSGPFEVISALMTVRFWFTTLMVSQKTSSVPLAAMGLGVGCLLLSVIFLAEGIAGSTSGEFIACVVAVIAVFVTLCLTIMFVKFLLTVLEIIISHSFLCCPQLEIVYFFVFKSFRKAPKRCVFGTRSMRSAFSPLIW